MPAEASDQALEDKNPAEVVAAGAALTAWRTEVASAPDSLPRHRSRSSRLVDP